MKIGFFDSGLGGLTILKAVAGLLPEYSYEFYGDTANLPYGDRREEEIYEMTKTGVEHLFSQNCALVIVACNTASAETLRKLQTTFLAKEHPDKKILGVIIPTIETVLETLPKRITLIGTRRTVESKKYEFEFLKFKDQYQVKIESIATPTLVPLIEKGELKSALEDTIKTLGTTTGERAIILGCTHYTLLKDELTKKYQNSSMHFFSQDEIIPKKLKTYLENHPEIKTKLNRLGGRNIYLTKHTDKYDRFIFELFS